MVFYMVSYHNAFLILYACVPVVDKIQTRHALGERKSELSVHFLFSLDFFGGGTAMQVIAPGARLHTC